MNLGQLIERLKREDPNREIPIGFCNPHSHRGDYSQLAFEVELEVTIRSLLSAAEHAVNRDFEGYKGGSYRMTLETECYLTSDQSMSGIKIDTALLDRLLLNPSSDWRACYTCGDSGRGEPTLEYPDGEDCPDCAHPMEMEDFERSGYILAMRLLQSDLDLDDVEMGAIAQFTQPEVMRRVLRAMK